MIALFVNDEPELIDTTAKVQKIVDEIKLSHPDADIEKRDAALCKSCGSRYFYESDAVFCGCHDHY
ncbi:hypothetical protein [Photobacterium kishitanii]|uniref:Uncharacterized protein n=1 Tax=Photobacterium kishitanii TaxID=318456 RepID=A0A2T3KKZ5_9GAMM|nr:hypothetical protein [Photobacterium kishitanii]PSV00317.1 hypothetical protein C9J27_04115 [Photobacterium kishitanii]